MTDVRSESEAELSNNQMNRLNVRCNVISNLNPFFQPVKQLLICRAHSFPRPRNTAEFMFLPAELTAEFVFPRSFDVFHSNNYFFTENDLKVDLLQVCLR